jgi:hypothetical protein
MKTAAAPVEWHKAISELIEEYLFYDGDIPEAELEAMAAKGALDMGELDETIGELSMFVDDHGRVPDGALEFASWVVKHRQELCALLEKALRDNGCAGILRKEKFN